MRLEKSVTLNQECELTKSYNACVLIEVVRTSQYLEEILQNYEKEEVPLFPL